MSVRAPRRLRCEYLESPLGIDAAAPRLDWLLDDPRPGARQSAYHVLVASQSAVLQADEGDLWNSGRVASRSTSQIEYAGAPLGSRQRAYWKVRSFDAEGAPSPWSEPAHFEMGLLELDDWSARWIGTPLRGTPRRPAVVPVLRRAFHAGAVSRARVYVSALGLYELSLNGSRVGDHELAPGWTDYRSRVRYQVHDVAPLLREGENSLEVLLGDGWYCGNVGLAEREQYGERPHLMLQLELDGPDGLRQSVVSDASWTWTPSAVLESDLMLGETRDARQEPGASGQPALVFELPGVALVATASPPIRAVCELKPVGPPAERPGRRRIYDFGQNMVGRVRVRARGRRGATLVLRHAEVLDESGDLYTENLRGARQEDAFTLAGDESGEVFEPRFTFHGFRYVELSGSVRAENIEEVTGVVLHSDLGPSGVFECSDERLNRLQANITWGQRGNFLDVPTDCPQRNERLGWTGDAQVFVRTAAFNMDVAAFFAKWLTDLTDAQAEDGRIPPFAPVWPGRGLPAQDGGPAWADALLICPWTMYRCYGDVRLLEQHYAAMVAFVENLERRFPEGIRSDPALDPWGGFGDWLSMDSRPVGDARFGGTPKDLIGTAFFCHSAGLLANIAGVLARGEDEARFAALARRVRDAFRARFVTPAGRLSGETQTAYVLALHFDLLEGAERDAAAASLVRDIESRGDHLATGFVGTPYLLHVLTDIGRLDVAYRLLFQTTCPSWLYPLSCGATTVWERWDGWTEEHGFQDPAMNSFNHYAYGAVGEWLYQSVAGLALDPDWGAERNAYRHARLEPRPPLGPGFDGPPPLTHASATLDSIHGRYETAWRLGNDSFELDVRIPPNCSADVRLPDGSQHQVGAGAHHFAIKPTPR